MTHLEVEILAIGAGPANLALAVALEELAPDLAKGTLLVEQSEGTVWQRGLLVPWAQSQVSFLKDLATLRNPRSRFTFVNYLHESGRLDDFMSMGTFTPYRREISDYLQWVASELEHVKLHYNRRAVGIAPVRDTAGHLAHWDVTFADGSVVRARHLVAACGRDPHVPEVFRSLPGERVVHSNEYSQRMPTLPTGVPQRIAVIGGAQSAVEMVRAVRDDLPGCSRVLITRGIGLTPYVTSKFISRYYSTAASREFFDLGSEGRGLILSEMERSSYSGVTPELLDSLYDEMYRDRLEDKEGLCILTSSEVVSAREIGDEVVLTLSNRLTGEQSELTCDAVLLGTGYDQAMPALVRRLGETLGLSELKVLRDYRVSTGDHDADSARLYLQGVNETTHGIADSLLSTMANRAADIVADMTAGAPAGGDRTATA